MHNHLFWFSSIFLWDQLLVDILWNGLAIWGGSEDPMSLMPGWCVLLTCSVSNWSPDLALGRHLPPQQMGLHEVFIIYQDHLDRSYLIPYHQRDLNHNSLVPWGLKCFYLTEVTEANAGVLGWNLVSCTIQAVRLDDQMVPSGLKIYGTEKEVNPQWQSPKRYNLWVILLN